MGGLPIRAHSAITASLRPHPVFGAGPLSLSAARRSEIRGSVGSSTCANFRMLFLGVYTNGSRGTA